MAQIRAMSANENLTIVFTDIVNYTAMTSAMSREESRILLQRHDALLLPLVSAFRGRRVKAIGDAMLLSFRSPTDAIHCGMSMQDALAEARQRDPAFETLHIRVAVNLGEVRTERNDIFGEPVNIASRIEGITPADEVYFSEAVYLAMNKAEVPSEALGEHQLKGIPEPVRVYRVPPHKFSRLVPAGADRDQDQGLPFGGAHMLAPSAPLDVRQYANRLWTPIAQSPGQARIWLTQRLANVSRWRGSIRRVGLGVAVGSILIGSALVLTNQPGPSPPAIAPTLAPPATVRPQASANPATGRQNIDRALLQAAETHLEAQDVDSLESLLAAQPAATDTASLRLVQGHLAFATDNIRQGTNDYAQAITQRPELAENSRLATNLVNGLGKINDLVVPLLLQHPSASVLQALSQRSGEPGYYGRIQAIDVLRRLERDDLIDRYGHALEELKGRSQCEDRLAAVRELREIGNPDAIPALRDAMGEGFGGWWENRCLRGAARDAIDALQGPDNETSNDDLSRQVGPR